MSAYIQSLRDPERAYGFIKQFIASKSGKPMTGWERVYYVLTMSRLEAYTLTEEKPLDVIGELEELAKTLDQPWIEGEALLHRAILAKETGEYENGLSYLDEVLLIAKQTGFKNLTARALKWQANIWYYQSKYDQVLSNYLKALSYFEEQQDYAQVVLVLSNIGNMYTDIDQWALAKKYNEKAFEVFNHNHIKNDYTATLLYIHAGLVANYFNLENEEAGYIRKAIKHASKTGSSYIQLVTLTNYTSVLLDENKLEASLKMSKECLQLADNIKDRVGRAFCYESKSLAYLELKELNEAISTALVALDIYKEYGSNSQVIRLYKLLSDIYSKNGNYKVSLEYFQRYVNEKESHYLRAKREEIRSLQTQYITQKKEHQIALLKADSELKSAQITSQHSREIILLLSILLGAAVLGLLYRRNNHLSKDNVELAQSNVSLTEQSFQDPLTGMYNRRYIKQWITGEIKGEMLELVSILLLCSISIISSK
ncbi:GGDEF domain-containing protein [Photobacterium sanguinicancri]|uniref:GGDEF domain-containing protein n=1 Tax=Photobacterium sanguinicancri TaxID=875932 RepID=UPI0012EE94B1|nr:GGDEF domain-containing protein [Photobacterium sanguinicancri]